MENRILYVRLPCNPIFPIGVVYLAVSCPEASLTRTVPPGFHLCPDLCRSQPTLLIFSWRDIQFMPCGGRGGNPLQNAFEFYARNPLIKLQRCHGTTLSSFLLHRTLAQPGVNQTGVRRSTTSSPAVVGGGAVSVFYEQLGDLPPGTIVSVGEGENTGKFLQGEISGRALLRGRRKPATRSHDPRATHAD